MPNPSDAITIEELAQLGINTPQELESLLVIMGAKQRVVNRDDNPNLTKLPMDKEAKFRQWLSQTGLNYDPNDANPTYDMRGYFNALDSGTIKPQYVQVGEPTALGNRQQQLVFPEQFNIGKTDYYKRAAEKLFAPNAPPVRSRADEQLFNKARPSTRTYGEPLAKEFWSSSNLGWDDGRQ